MKYKFPMKEGISGQVWKICTYCENSRWEDQNVYCMCKRSRRSRSEEVINLMKTLKKKDIWRIFKKVLNN